MKKLLILLIVGISFNVVNAQGWNDDRDKTDRYQVNNRDDDRRWQNETKYNNNIDRQEAYNRMNRQYDQRISNYRNDRSINRYERDRRIRAAEMDRQQKAASFGKGLVVGGLAAIAIGVLIGH